MKKLTLATAMALTLSACGGSSSDETTSTTDDGTGSTTETQTGVFVDSEVGNIDYRTETQSGTTNAAGEFSYVAGENVTFSIGELDLPTGEADDIVTPISLTGATSVTDAPALNLVRFLLSLDQDGDPDNGIAIAEAAKDVATANIDFFVPTDEFEASSAVLDTVRNAGQDQAVDGLVTAEAATQHAKSVLEGLGLAPASIVGAFTQIETPEGEEAPEDVVLVFRADGTFYQVEVNNPDQGNSFEFGEYEYSMGDFIPVEIPVDIGIGAGLSTLSNGAEIDVEANGLTLTVEENDTELSYGFDRVVDDQQPLVGAWLLNNSDEEVVFVFETDGTFTAIQPIASNNEIGFEWGTYDYDAGTSEVTIELAVDTSGATLTSDIVIDSLSVDGNTLTVSIAGESDITFSRIIEE